MHRDFSYFVQAREAGGLPAEKLIKRRDELVERFKQVLPQAVPTNKPPGYEKTVRHAATTQSKDPDRWAYLWNIASGAGHGQNWFSLEGYSLEMGEEYEPGYHRVTRLPGPDFITEIVEAAADTLQYGVLKWAQIGGYPYQERYTEALHEIHARMPKVDGQSGSGNA